MQDDAHSRVARIESRLYLGLVLSLGFHVLHSSVPHCGRPPAVSASHLVKAHRCGVSFCTTWIALMKYKFMGLPIVS